MKWDQEIGISAVATCSGSSSVTAGLPTPALVRKDMVTAKRLHRQCHRLLEILRGQRAGGFYRCDRHADSLLTGSLQGCESYWYLRLDGSSEAGSRWLQKPL